MQYRQLLGLLGLVSPGAYTQQLLALHASECSTVRIQHVEKCCSVFCCVRRASLVVFLSSAPRVFVAAPPFQRRGVPTKVPKMMEPVTTFHATDAVQAAA
jgi:hypothetical protein